MEEFLGKQGVWYAKTDENGSLKIGREDNKFFEVGMITAGYDRPIILNYGIGRTSVVLVDGKVATEPETIVTNMDGTEAIHQNRILRASADNPNYSGLPADTLTGKNFLDGQRIIYRDGPVQSFVSTADVAPQRKTKDGFVDCELVSLKEYGKTVDSPGKTALFDAMATYLTEDELAEIVNKIAARI